MSSGAEGERKRLFAGPPRFTPLAGAPLVGVIGSQSESPKAPGREGRRRKCRGTRAISTPMGRENLASGESAKATWAAVSTDDQPGCPAPWQWPGLWSLNLPVLLVLWQMLFAQTFHVWLGGYHFAAAGALVWTFAATERWIFVFRLKRRDGEPLSPDLIDQRSALVRICLLVGAGLVLVAVFRANVREVAGMMIWTALGGAYLVGLRLRPGPVNEFLPREMAYAAYLSGVGFLFVWANGAFPPWELVLPALLFMVLLFYYFSLVVTWSKSSVPVPAGGALFDSPLGLAFRLVPLTLIFGGAFLAWITPAVVADQVLLTIAVSGLILLLLDLWKHSLSHSASRLLADVALLAPAIPILITL